MEFRKVELVIENGTELKDLDKARSLLDRLPLVVESHEGNRNAAGFGYMRLGVHHCQAENGRHLAVLRPCSDYSVGYEGFNKLPPKDYRVKIDIYGKGQGPKSAKVHSIRIIPKYKSEMDLELVHQEA